MEEKRGRRGLAGWLEAGKKKKDIDRQKVSGPIIKE
jgi:hypothetical protein